MSVAVQSKEAGGRVGHPWLVLLTVMVGTLLIGLDRTVVNLALPDVISEFGITVSTSTWIATAYIISNAIFVPVFGKLGDLFGNRVIYLWSFVGFIIVSVLAGLAWSFGSLVFFRVIQGLVGAAVYPTAMSLIARSFADPKSRAQALGIWSSSFAVSAVIGPLLGGYLVDNFSWRSVFYINLPIGILGLFMVQLFLPHDRPSARAAFDWVGACFVAVAISSMVLVLDRGQDWGWSSSGSLLCYFLMIAFGYLTYRWETRHESPIIDFKLFKNPVFTSVLVMSFISFGGMMGAMFLLPVFTQTILMYDATQSGYLLLPMALALPVAAPLGARLSGRFHPRYIVSFGLFLCAAGLYLMRTLDPAMSSVDFILPLALFGFGLGLGMAPLTSAATTSVPAREVGVSSGLLNLTRNVGGAFGIAIFGTLLNGAITSNLLTVADNSVIRTTVPALQAQAQALIIMKSELLAYGTVFVYASVVMFIGAVLALLFLRVGKVAEELSDEQKAEAMAVG
jgi:DHA2 family multidrug resistance protein